MEEEMMFDDFLRGDKASKRLFLAVLSFVRMGAYLRWALIFRCWVLIGINTMLFNQQIKLKESEDSVTLGVECQNVLMFYDKADINVYKRNAPALNVKLKGNTSQEKDKKVPFSVILFTY
ncbi:unnamed protein product [Porites evermanni]|uniref:Uncharacterized protein n=1 Tax=Porites evermanni TaxID=104178 RepID=A0ABN8M4V6_9CNID|nr:unnamed protein product [Porites evermanni]